MSDEDNWRPEVALRIEALLASKRPDAPQLPGDMDKRIAELMGKMDKCFDGYPRMVVVLACTRCIAAMFGPAQQETRDEWMRRMPDYMRSMWTVMDKIAQ